MYIPEHFARPEREKAIAFIKNNAFGQLVSQVEGRLFASHVPFAVTVDNASLLCHIARQNPQWKGIEGQEVMVTFQGPHGYVSPRWYQAPGVPTWNYQAVHVYGSCRPIHAVDELRTIVEELTRRHESDYPAPWEPQYSEAMLQSIVGLELSITAVECKFKLNQNRSGQDRDGVIAALEEAGNIQLASAMRDHES